MEYVFEAESDDIVEVGEDEEEEIVVEEIEEIEDVDVDTEEEEEIFPIRRKPQKIPPVFHGPPLRPEK